MIHFVVCLVVVVVVVVVVLHHGSFGMWLGMMMIRIRMMSVVVIVGG
jgi:hypothetical protein